jgi:hypothetical protein
MGGSRSESAVGYLSGFLDHGVLYCEAYRRFTCSVAMWIRPVLLFPLVPSLIRAFPIPSTLYHRDKSLAPMPAYCLQDCHYFYRSALRHLSIATSISPLYA